MATPFQQFSALESINAVQLKEKFQTPVDINSRAFLSVRLQLTSVLQTSLDITEIIGLFFKETQAAVQYEHIHYKHPALELDYETGKKQQHSCNYRLIHDKNVYGDITLTRAHPFCEQELCVLEALMSTLICPLRNGLMYLDALQAATRDPLTGLGSRASLDTALTHNLSIAKRHQYPFSLLLLDIDKFKQINDTYGHSAGDIVLKEVAQAIMAITRQTDQAFRYGGEEFVVILEKTDEDEALLIAERIRQRIESMLIAYNGQTIVATASIGVASVAKHDTTNTIFDRADGAMYYAKKNGRNQVVSSSLLVE